MSGWWPGSSDVYTTRRDLSQRFIASVPALMSRRITTSSVFNEPVSCKLICFCHDHLCSNV